MVNITNAKELESAIKSNLDRRKRYQYLLAERIVDTAAAGNIVGKTPADFYILHDGRFGYIEAKFSATIESLRSGFSHMVKPHQLASARLVHRAGGNYWIIFYSAVSKQFELWDGLYCANQRSRGMPLSLQERLILSSDLDDVLYYILTNADRVQTDAKNKKHKKSA